MATLTKQISTKEIFWDSISRALYWEFFPRTKKHTFIYKHDTRKNVLLFKTMITFLDDLKKKEDINDEQFSELIKYVSTNFIKNEFEYRFDPLFEEKIENILSKALNHVEQ